MHYYITFGDIQRNLKEYYEKTGNRMQFLEMMIYLHGRHLLSEEPLERLSPRQMLDDMEDEEINAFIDTIVCKVNVTSHDPTLVMEADIIPDCRDVFIIRHPRYTRKLLHAHNYFEINYVADGQCNFVFEDSSRVMREGELCIIAPGSRHDVTIDDESTVFCIMLRKSTFNQTFLSLLSQDDLLAQFFRTVLSDGSNTNYLLFFCERSEWIRRIVFNAMVECYKADPYSNTCCISWLNQLFAYLLRNYSRSLQFYDYHLGYEFPLVLQYIQHNYQTITLSSLAEFFHYSKPYLCTLIKQNTGKNFTELIKDLRLTEAVKYLTNTNMKINEIAESVGYHSSDHFSRVFRSRYHTSPQQYRKEYGMNLNGEEEPFIPFSINS